MKFFEMEGFLRGKCIPRDLKVNETNAEYLVRKLAEADAMCAALAAEKEKFAVECAATKIAIAYLKSGRHDFTLNTPATDAFLAEVRAQESKRVYESILDNPAVTDMESLVDWLEQNANDSVAFAAQLRKGVQS
ncbi:TPA: hypothetical protein ACOSBP_004024 [Enterobacter hormaechei]